VTIRVREAETADFRVVAALLEELGRPKVLGDPEEDAHAKRFAEWIDHPDRFVFLASDGDDVVGLVDLWFYPRLNFGSAQGWIPDLVVTEAARSKGAGAALLARCEELAKERGAWGLRLESATWRERAHAFYEREGWKHTAKSFDKLLGDLDWPPPPPKG
jgi:GNAT superfamily N-acetyltransferase